MPEVVCDLTGYDPAIDILGVRLEMLKAQAKSAQIEIDKLNSKKGSMFHFIWQSLSHISQDRVKMEGTYDELLLNCDVLGLYKNIEKSHNSGIGIVNTEDSKGDARLAYYHIKQLSYESLVIYKERFDHVVKNYNAHQNPPIPPAETAIDFMNSLDDIKYYDLKRTVNNNRAMGTGQPPGTVNEMYEMISNFAANEMPTENYKSGSAAYVTQTYNDMYI